MAGHSRVRLYLVFGLFLISALAYFDRTNISVAGLPLSREFALNRVQLGWIFSAFLLGYAGFQVPAGWLAVRFGPRKALSAAILWWCAFSAAITLVSPAFGSVLPQLIAVRFVLGMGEALMYPAANQFIAYWIPRQERAKATGWLFGGVGIGAGVTPPLINWLMSTYGWRSSFWFSAIIGLFAAAAWYFAARDRPQQHPAISTSELAYISASATHDAGGVKTPVPWGAMVTSRSLWMLSLAYFCFGYIAYIFLTWFFIYLADAHGLDLKKSALYSVLPFISMTIFCLTGGVISDRLVRSKSAFVGRCVFPSIALFLTALLLFAGSRTADPLMATIILAGGAGTLYLSQSSYFAVVAELAGPHTGVVAGWVNTANQIAGAITASATPWIALQFGWSSAFYVAAGFALLGSAAWLMVDPTEPLAQPM
jgi:ACS family glucarate transporter-like MFS transporter